MYVKKPARAWRLAVVFSAVLFGSSMLSANYRVFGPSGLPKFWLNADRLRVSTTGSLPAGLLQQLGGESVPQLVLTAFSAWAVPTSSLRRETFQYAGDLGVSVLDQESFQKLQFDAEILVAFDSAGAFFGQVLAPQPGQLITKGVTWNRGVYPAALDSTFVVIRANAIDSRDELFAILKHEAGHALGLGHSAVNWPLNMPNPVNPALLSLDRPIMSPVIVRRELHADDEASMSGLYLSDMFPTQYGRIRGTVLDPSGNELNGVQVTATLLLDNGQDSPSIKYSVFTPFSRRSVDGRFEHSGTYELVLVPGSYRIEVNNIPVYFNVPWRYQEPVYASVAPVIVARGQDQALEPIRVSPR